MYLFSWVHSTVQYAQIAEAFCVFTLYKERYNFNSNAHNPVLCLILLKFMGFFDVPIFFTGRNWMTTECIHTNCSCEEEHVLNSSLSYGWTVTIYLRYTLYFLISSLNLSCYGNRQNTYHFLSPAKNFSHRFYRYFCFFKYPRCFEFWSSDYLSESNLISSLLIMNSKSFLKQIFIIKLLNETEIV